MASTTHQARSMSAGLGEYVLLAVMNEQSLGWLEGVRRGNELLTERPYATGP